MSKENITLQDCLDNFSAQGETVIIKKGQVIAEKKPCKDGNPGKADKKQYK